MQHADRERIAHHVAGGGEPGAVREAAVAGGRPSGRQPLHLRARERRRTRRGGDLHRPDGEQRHAHRGIGPERDVERDGDLSQRTRGVRCAQQVRARKNVVEAERAAHRIAVDATGEGARDEVELGPYAEPGCGPHDAGDGRQGRVVEVSRHGLAREAGRRRRARARQRDPRHRHLVAEKRIGRGQRISAGGYGREHELVAGTEVDRLRLAASGEDHAATGDRRPVRAAHVPA